MRMPGAQHILIIEDEPAIADNIIYALETDGFIPHWCATAAAGLKALADSEVSLIILDVGLPDANGFDLCRELRKDSEIPIIFLTARADEIDRVVGLEMGADDYVVKPFSPRELSARVKAVLRRVVRGHAAEEEATVPLWVDDPRGVITYFGHKLPLARYEYRILQILVEQPGRIFSRDQLMRLAWEEPDTSLERTVDAHIKTLRAKLRAVRPHIDAIQTHRGMGYSLKEDW